MSRSSTILHILSIALVLSLASQVFATAGPDASVPSDLPPAQPCNSPKPQIDADNWYCRERWPASAFSTWVHQGDLHIKGNWFAPGINTDGFSDSIWIDGDFSIVGALVFRNSLFTVYANKTARLYRKSEEHLAPKNVTWIESPDATSDYGDYNMVIDWENFANWPPVPYNVYGSVIGANYGDSGISDAPLATRFIPPAPKYSSYCYRFESWGSARWYSAINSYVSANVHFRLHKKLCTVLPIVFAAIAVLVLLVIITVSCCICRSRAAKKQNKVKDYEKINN